MLLAVSSGVRGRSGGAAGSSRDGSDEDAGIDGGRSGRVGMSVLAWNDAASGPGPGPRGARKSACCWASRSALGAVGGFVGPMSKGDGPRPWRLSALGPVGIAGLWFWVWSWTDFEMEPNWGTSGTAGGGENCEAGRSARACGADGGRSWRSGGRLADCAGCAGGFRMASCFSSRADFGANADCGAEGGGIELGAEGGFASVFGA